ncbi:hypothetical protein [Actinoplanes sp. NPDC051859]|uniref:hypothetical protein n=1 Tax=Actinoplanes sp. NPDC051859 TaxID=3363909 RepID=UPI0037B4F5CB
MTLSALDLEQIMLHPHYDRIVQQARALAPAAVIDEADIATGQAFNVLTKMAESPGSGGLILSAPKDIPGWLRLSVMDAVATYFAGRADTCRHSPSPRAPIPVFAAAWRPGVVSCGACCGYLFAIPSDTDADATCDRCGHRCTGVAAGDPICPAMVQFGPLVYQYGVCRDCLPPQAKGVGNADTPRRRRAARGRRGRGGRR